MSSLGNLSVTLSADTTSYLAGMSAAAKSVEQTVKHMRQMTGAATAAGAALTAMGGAIMAEAAKWSAPAAAATKAMKDSFASLSVELSTLLLPAMHGIADAVKTLADQVAALTPSQKELAMTVVAWGAGLAAAATTLTLVLPLVQALAAASAGLLGVLAAIGAPVLLALGVVAVGLVVLHKAWRENWGGMQTKVKEVVENILKWTRAIPDAVLDALAAFDKMTGRKVDVQLALTGVADPKIAEENARMERNIDRETARLKAKGALEVLSEGASQLGDLVAAPLKAFGAEVKIMGAELVDWAKGLIPASAGKSINIDTGGKGGHKLGEVDLRQADEIASKAMAKLADELAESTRKTWSEIGEAEAKAAAEAAEMLSKAGETMANVVRDAAKEEADARAAALNHWTLISTKAAHEYRTAGENIKVALSSVASSLLSNMGTVGEVIQSGVQGFTAGGPWGAIIAVIGTILSKLEGFVAFADMLNKELFAALGKLNEALQPVFAALTAIVDAVKPLEQVVHSVIGVVIKSLMPVFKLLATVLGFVAKALAPLEPLFTALGTLSDALMPIIELFTGLGPILDILSVVFKVVGISINAVVIGILEVVKWVFGVLGRNTSDLTKTIEAQRQKMGTAMGELIGVFDKAADEVATKVSPGLMSESTRPAAGALDNLADSTKKVADKFDELVTNMPSGYKLRAAQFAADTGLSHADAVAIADAMASAWAAGMGAPGSANNPLIIPGGGGMTSTGAGGGASAGPPPPSGVAFYGPVTIQSGDATSLRELARAIANQTTTELKRTSRNGAVKMRTPG